MDDPEAGAATSNAASKERYGINIYSMAQP